jgi:hypothetical protein
MVLTAGEHDQMVMIGWVSLFQFVQLADEQNQMVLFQSLFAGEHDQMVLFAECASPKWFSLVGEPVVTNLLEKVLFSVQVVYI